MSTPTRSRRPAKKRPAKPSKSKPKTTKTEALLKLLHKTDGATLEELMKVSGWQAHSVRGFLSGTVRKKLGLKLVSENDDKARRRYRIVEAGEVE